MASLIKYASLGVLALFLLAFVVVGVISWPLWNLPGPTVTLIIVISFFLIAWAFKKA
jgi:hypothetical protein